MIIVDSSYTLALVMPDEARPVSMAAVLAGQLATPMIWPLEIANALRSSLRRQRLQAAQVEGLLARIGELQVDVMNPAHTQPRRHFDAAQEHGLTPYDAMYLELALQWRSALATRDAGLAAAAHRAGVAVLA